MKNKKIYKFLLLLIIFSSLFLFKYNIDNIIVNDNLFNMIPDNVFSKNYEEINKLYPKHSYITLVFEFSGKINFFFLQKINSQIKKINPNILIVDPTIFSNMEPLNLINKEKNIVLTHLLIEDPNINLDKYIEQLKDIISSNQHSNIKIYLTGIPVIKNEENNAVKKRSLFLSIISLILIFSLQIIIFKNIKHILIMILSILIGTIWTFIFISLTIKSLNIFTAMFIPVICGLGIDYSIHFIYSMSVDREKINRIVVPILLSTITTSLGFFFLLFSGFKLFFEFGLITAFGIIFMFMAILLIAPIFDLHEISFENILKKKIIDFFLMIQRKNNLKFTIIIIYFFFMLISFYGINKLKFDSNGDSLQNKNSISIYTGNLIQNNFGYYPTPSILLLYDKSESSQVINYLKKQNNVGFFLTSIDSLYINSILHKKKILYNTTSKLLILNKNKRIINSILFHKLNNYFETDCTRLFLIFPKSSFWNKKTTADFIKIMQQTPSKHFIFTGLPFIMREIANQVKLNIIFLFLIVYLIVHIINIAIFRNIKYLYVTFVYITSTYIISLGIFSLMGYDFNFINLLGLPLIAGIVIDDCIYFLYFIKLYNNDIKKTFIRIIIPITLTTLTTIIGFGMLIFYVSNGIKTLGIFLVIGFSVSYLLILTIIPLFFNSIMKDTN